METPPSSSPSPGLLKTPASLDPEDQESEILRFGEMLWRRMRGETPGLFNMDYWQGRLLDWAMRDPEFKVDLFRLVDVLPTLRDPEQVSQHVREYLLRDSRHLPGMINLALRAASISLTAGIAARAIKSNVTEIARRFIIGATVAEAMSALRRLRREGITFTVDLLGEATLSELEAVDYQARYFDLIERLADEVAAWPADPLLDQNHLGPIPCANVSIKLSALDPRLDSADPAGGVRRLREKVLPLFHLARRRNVFINFDMEQWETHEIILALAEEVLALPELADWPHVGIAVQAYLKSAPQDVERLLALARRRGTPLVVRLVKGAYWDAEVVR